MESRKLALLCRELADNKKAENLVILDVRKLSSVTDYFVIASGSSEPHLRAIVEEITGKLREDFGLRPTRMDGTVHGAAKVNFSLLCALAPWRLKSFPPSPASRRPRDFPDRNARARPRA